MAHYLSEQISLARKSKGRARHLAKKRCCETILAVWAQQERVPYGFRPTDGFNRILETLARLHPDAREKFYFDPAWREDVPNDERKQEIDLWLNFIERMDGAARTLIGIGVSAAAKAAEHRDTLAIVRAATTAGVSNEGRQAIDAMISDRRYASDLLAQRAQRTVAKVEGKIALLQQFRESCAIVEKFLGEELATAERGIEAAKQFVAATKSSPKS